MVVRPAVEADRAAIERVAKAGLEVLSWAPTVAQWGPDMRRGFVDGFLVEAHPGVQAATVVAEIDGGVAGAASVVRGQRHPHSFLEIAVLPDLRRRSLGSALLAALTRQGWGPFSVRASLSDEGSTAFYRSHGFAEGEICTEGIIDPSSAQTSAWIDAELASTDVLVESGDEPDLEIARAVDDLYRWIHPWSPPAPVPEERLEPAYLAGRVPGTTLTVRVGGEVAGVAMLHESPFAPGPGVAHLLWCGVRRPETAGAADLTLALAVGCLDAARRLGRIVEVEVNSPHRHLVDVVRSVPGAELFTDLIIMVSG